MAELPVRNDLGFQLVIEAKVTDTDHRYLYLDTCMEKRVRSSARIATQPLQDGNFMADHMYKEPDVFTVRGSFSLAGARANDESFFTDWSGDIAKSDRLTEIQSIFEYIKDKGILCDLTTYSPTGTGKTRFKTRSNMALRSITWVEKQLSMEYEFEFQEIICVEIPYSDQVNSDDYPSIYSPQSASLGMLLSGGTNEYGDSGYISLILQCLINAGFLAQSDVTLLANSDDDSGMWWVDKTPSEEELKIRKMISAASKNSASSYIKDRLNAGYFILSILTMGLSSAIMGAQEYANQGKRSKIFSLFRNTEKYIDANGVIDVANAMKDPNVKINEDSWYKFQQFIIAAKNKILDIKAGIDVYQLSTGKDDNQARELCVTLNGRPYYLIFDTKDVDFPDIYSHGLSKTYTRRVWYANVKTIDINGKTVSLASSTAYGKLVNNEFPITSILDADYRTNALFMDAEWKNEVYLLFDNSSIDLNNYQIPYRTIDTIDADPKQLAYAEALLEYQYLCNYYLIISNGHISDNITEFYNQLLNFINDQFPV